MIIRAMTIEPSKIRVGPTSVVHSNHAKLSNPSSPADKTYTAVDEVSLDLSQSVSKRAPGASSKTKTTAPQSATSPSTPTPPNNQNKAFLGDHEFLVGQARLEVIDAATPAEAVQSVTTYCLGLPCINKGLETAYSPNHKEGMTTHGHIRQQFRMLNHYVGREMKAVEAFQTADYETLAAMVANDKVPEKLQTTAQDLKEVMGPLREGLTSSDWKVLSIVAGFHDLGKIDPEWAAKNGMNLESVDWIAHDYDSETMLKTNPDLLGPFKLDADEKEKVLTLSRLHSLPGQFFFGEGNISAYSPLHKMAGEQDSENILKMARIHGILDVMSALNNKFVKPILDSHKKLKTMISEAYEHNTPLGMKYRQSAVEELNEAGPEFLELANNHGLGPVAMLRLRRLTSTKLPAETFSKALNDLEPTMIYEFQEATDSENTWFGTYVANAFGGGMLRALKDTDVPPSEAVAATVKIVACAARHQRQLEEVHGPREEWALGSLAPSLHVASGADGAREILAQTQKIETVDQGVSLLTTQETGLTMRGGRTGIEIGFTPSPEKH